MKDMENNSNKKNKKNIIINTVFIVFFLTSFISGILFALYHAYVQNRLLREEKKKLLVSEKKLMESEMLFRTIFDQATVGIAIGHDGTNIMTEDENRPLINPMLQKIIGRSKEKIMNMNWTDLTHPEDASMDLEQFQQFIAGEIDGYDIEKRYLRPDNSEVWVHMILSRLSLENTKQYNHICIIEDISKRKEMENVIHNNERIKTLLLDNLPGMVYRCKYDHEWTMEYVSEGFFDLTGYKAESLLNNRDITFNELIHPKYQNHLWNKWLQVVKDNSRLKEEYELITASGELKWVYEQGLAIYDEKGNVIALEGLIIDITERKNQEMRLEYINNHDSLTGLYNRRYFNEVITNDLKNDDKEKKAVILINIRKFSMINFTFGYSYGEKLVKELAENLTSLITNKCLLFHLSFDRFAFYITNYHDKEELTILCDSIIDIMMTTLNMKVQGGSIGVVEIDSTYSEADSILKNASIAADNVSEALYIGYVFFDKRMVEKMERETMIKNDLSKVIQDEYNESIYMEYQPIYDVKNNCVHGFEALSRLRSDTLGIVSPGEFIPIAEDAQLIVPLGNIIMLLVFRFCKELELLGHCNFTMSFNVSSMQLIREDFIPSLIRNIDDSKVDANKLIMEITESAFLNNYQEVNKKLDKIKELGIKIAIDDFGTGYSSFARARELNVNCLKIDKLFIDKLMEHNDITADIISMAHKLGHFVIAEGVEYEKQKKYLIENDCDLMQGYLFYKPLSQDSAIEVLKKNYKQGRKLFHNETIS